jgi:hypothetical protein
MRPAFPSLFLVLALGACSSDERYEAVVPQVVAANTRDYVREAVTDPARAEALLRLVDRCEKLELELDRAQQAFLAELERTNARLEAGEAELAALLDRALAERARISDQLFDSKLELRARATPEEWQRIVELEAQGLGANLRRERRAAFGGGGRS